MGSLYWYSLEFGVCKEANRQLGYGAGIASSIGEIENLIGGRARFRKFNPMVDCDEPYPIQKVQEVYRVTEDFGETLRDIFAYGQSVKKPMKTTFNAEKKVVEYDRNIECKDFGDASPNM